MVAKVASISDTGVILNIPELQKYLNLDTIKEKVLPSEIHLDGPFELTKSERKYSSDQSGIRMYLQKVSTDSCKQIFGLHFSRILNWVTL